MSRKGHLQPSPDRITTLVQRLAETEEELRELLGDQFDLVIVPTRETPRVVRQIQQSYQEAATQYYALLQRVPLPVFELSPSGRILYVNQAVAEITGYASNNLSGKNWWLTFYPGERLSEAFRLHGQLCEGDVTQSPTSITSRDGTLIRISLSSTNQYGADGNLQRIIGVCSVERPETTPTAVHHADDTCLETLSHVIPHIPCSVIIYNQGGDIIGMNDAARDIFQYPEPIRALQYPQRIQHFSLETPEGKPFTFDQLPVYRALRGETVQGEVFVLRRHDGRTFMLSASAGPIMSADGRQTGAILACMDITPFRDLQQQQKAFVHTVSHDLRIPLTVLQGHSQLLLDSLQDHDLSAQVAKHIQAITRGVQRMDVMIDDLVDVARIEGKQLRLHCEAISLQEFLDEFLSNTSLTTTRIRLDIPESLPPVYADPDRLERILNNLFSNALKYSSDDSPVSLIACQREEQIAISVRDQGRGIDPRDLEHLFERFYRAHGARVAEGIGLGLYITRMLVEAHGGTITVDSVLNFGSTFTFTLPAACDR